MIICRSIRSLSLLHINIKISQVQHLSLLSHPGNTFNSFYVCRSILGSSWFWMSGDPMDFTQWDEASQEPSPCGGISSTERSTWRQRFCGEHLNFICFTGRCPVYRPITRSSSAKSLNLLLICKHAPTCASYNACTRDSQIRSYFSLNFFECLTWLKVWNRLKQRGWSFLFGKTGKIKDLSSTKLHLEVWTRSEMSSLSFTQL